MTVLQSRKPMTRREKSAERAKRMVFGDSMRSRAFAILAVLACASTLLLSPARAASSAENECFEPDRGQRIAACTELLQQPDLPPAYRSSVYAQRALSLSLIGRHADAIADYDQAIELNPQFPVALNNRAWALFRSGNVRAAWPDVEKSLKLDPWSAHARDTRAHLHQADGKSEAAYLDYKSAMQLGGAEMVKLYQCGLQAEGHYNGPRHGIITEQLLAALKVCVKSKTCDPLPPDEECKIATS